MPTGVYLAASVFSVLLTIVVCTDVPYREEARRT
jgi:hypothetical protein